MNSWSPLRPLEVAKFWSYLDIKDRHRQNVCVICMQDRERFPVTAETSGSLKKQRYTDSRSFDATHSRRGPAYRAAGQGDAFTHKIKINKCYAPSASGSRCLPVEFGPSANEEVRIIITSANRSRLKFRWTCAAREEDVRPPENHSPAADEDQIAGSGHEITRQIKEARPHQRRLQQGVAVQRLSGFFCRTALTGECRIPESFVTVKRNFRLAHMAWLVSGATT
ncbi:hypothetical protein EVAR_67594_1 [Eumeta japonica]|uniref:Uncharacterized protein n=1 Tax=Eumeta variegata TaxID=151549 RepID=A0A4C2A8U4_EUMVA|nr:hypothetical protein EVAR_67594_1 [Eumeta japonica]